MRRGLRRAHRARGAKELSRESQELFESPLDSSSAAPDEAALASWCSRVLDAAMLLFQRLAWHSIRIVVSMGQVLTLLGLSVADPLRSAVAVLSIDVPALFVHFECHGINHSYYAGWLVAANFPRPRFGAP